MTSKVTVLLTACIDPSTGGARMTRADPKIRLEDYCQGLRFWIGLKDPRLTRIVFAENSGYPLDAIQQISDDCRCFGKECEIIATSDNWLPPGVQYGYAELGMVDAALGQSRLLRESEYFIKATGRLTFPRVSRLLDRLPEGLDFAVETRDFKIGTNIRRFVTTQIAFFSCAYYRRELVEIRQQLKPEGPDSIEKLFYAKLMPRLGTANCLLRFPTNCDPHGMAAHGFKSYDTLSQLAVRYVRGIGRRVAPNVWF